MLKGIVVFHLMFAILIAADPAAAQQAGKVPRIGFLSPVSAKAQKDRLAAFRAGLKEAGYAEGKDIVIAARYADGRLARLPALAAELVASGVAMIVAQGAAARAAKKAVTTIPLIVIQSDPVSAGLVDNFAHPGGNVTGLATQPASLMTKRLQLLKDTVPSVSRIAVLGYDPSGGGSHGRQIKALQAAAPTLGVTLKAVALKKHADFDGALSAIVAERPDALIVLGHSLFRARRKQIADFALANRLPTMFSIERYVVAGGLMSYGTNVPDLFRRAAHYVDRILHGAKPADLPVELPAKFLLAVNLKTAKALGIAFPKSILLRATKFVE